LVEKGLGEDADSAARMLFETMLAAYFILRRRVSLKRQGARVPPVAGKPLTTRFRARLYLAHNAFNERKYMNVLLSTPGLKRGMSSKVRAEILRQATEWENEIGPDWTTRLKQANSFSGLRIDQLAETFGFERLYQAVYRTLSAGVHATDATSHINLEGFPEELRFLVAPSTEGIANTLKFTGIMFIKILQVADDRFGLDMKTRAETLLEQVAGMRSDFDEDAGKTTA
jgi:hypothetical protein